MNVESLLAEAFHFATRQLDGLVIRIIENLDFQPISGVVHSGDRIEQALNHSCLVVERQLNRHPRQLSFDEGRNFPNRGQALAVAVAEPHQVRAVRAISAKQEKDGEIRDDNQRSHMTSAE